MTVNTNGVRTCAVSGCTHAVMPGKLMCLAHWERVPRSVQFDVYRSWATFKKARKPNLVRAALRAYRAAREAAVKAVQV